MAKAGLLEPQSPAEAIVDSTGSASEAGVVACGGLMEWSAHLPAAKRHPVRVFEGMNGAPKSRSDVRRRRTWDRLRDASPTATECP